MCNEEIKWTPKVNTKLETCGLSPLIRNKEISTSKTDQHDITEILLQVELNTITLIPP
jgi:hypothetical protein